MNQKEIESISEAFKERMTNTNSDVASKSILWFSGGVNSIEESRSVMALEFSDRLLKDGVEL